jgi:hypothetical protein
MQTSHPTCDADSCLSVKEPGVDIVSIIHQRTPTLVPLRSTWRWRLVFNELAWELGLFGNEQVIAHPRSSSSGKNTAAGESMKGGMVR